MNIFKFLVIISMLLISSLSFSSEVIVISTGEAKILNGDIPTARNIAISRAKWNGLDKAVSSKVTVDTIVSNSRIIDEGIKSEVQGVIKSYKIIDEKSKNSIYKVTIEAVIENTTLINNDKHLAPNINFGLLILSRMPDGNMVFVNKLSETIEVELISKGFNVTLINSYNKGSLLNNIDNINKGFNENNLMQLFKKYKVSYIILGMVNISSRGKNVGYTNIKSTIIDGSLSWQLIKLSNKVDIIASGNHQGRGQGSTMNMAVNNMFEGMSKDIGIKITSIIFYKLLGDNHKGVKVILRGNTSTTRLQELVKSLKNIPFVLNTRVLDTDSIYLNYPDKIYYLVSFIKDKNLYKIISFDEYEIILEKP